MRTSKLFSVLFFTIIVASSLETSLLAQQKVVIISGATSGIGLAAVRDFYEKGWKVWAGFHQRHIPFELQGIDGIRFCPLDVTNLEQIQRTVTRILDEDGRIDALINNAGYGLIGAEECVTIEEAQQVFDVNFFGALRLIQEVLPIMRAQKGGYIINISSAVGVHAFPGLGLYSASKFALEGLTESLAVTVAPWNIKVSLVEPGFVKTRFGKNCLVGTGLCHENFYKSLTEGIVRMLASSRGQSPTEISELLVKITETECPDLRYQTSSYIQEYIAEKLIDPTGNIEHEKSIQFINRLIKI